MDAADSGQPNAFDDVQRQQEPPQEPAACTAVVAAVAAAAAVAVATGGLAAPSDDGGGGDGPRPTSSTQSTENLVAAPEPKRNPRQPRNPVTVGSSYTVQVNYLNDNTGFGLRTSMIAIFVAGEMSGIGMITAPWAISNLGPAGFLLLLTLGMIVAHNGRCLGTCWMIVEERFYECRQYPIINQYATIARHAIGHNTSVFAKASIYFTLFGAATVYLMLVAQSAQKLFADTYPEISFCTWLFVFAVVLGAAMFVESPKNVRIVAGSVLLSIMAASYVIIVQILHYLRSNDGRVSIPRQQQLDANQLSLSFGTLAFSVGGTLAFPAIQNNMFKRNEYSRSVLVSFMILSMLFGTIVVGAYVVYGDHVQPNILMSLENSLLSYSAIVLVMIHLALGFLIIVNPVTENLETFFDDTITFGFQRFVVRVFLVTFMIVVGIIIQDFSNLATLLGSSTVTLGMIVMPQVFYLSLCSKKSRSWPDRSLSWKAKICPYLIIAGGLAFSAFSTYAAVERMASAGNSIKLCYLPWFYATD